MNPLSNSDFADELRRARHAAGFSQEELAERAGLTAAAVGALERGVRRHPYPQTVRALADALELAPAERAALFAAVPRRHGAAPDEPAAAPLPEVRAWSIPTFSTPLVGRDDELARLREIVLQPRVRLLTLSGPGGAGKTRLACALAADVADAFPGGAAFADLSSLSEPSLVLPIAGRALGITAAGEEGVVQAVGRCGWRGWALLVLDNFEHLMGASAGVARLLDACDTLKILVTSREPLRLRAEQEVVVAPLRVPEASRRWEPSALAGVPAVALFAERARAVDPDFELDAATAPAVGELCRRLDGLPLAIELAAARVRAIHPVDLAARVGQIDLFASGSSDLPSRHRTLEAAIEWSVSLLADDERALLESLATFAGGWSLDAAEEVAAGGPGPPVAATLASLVDKSLVQRAHGGPSRYRLLETVRAYALARLARRGLVETFRERHARYFRARLSALNDDLFSTRPQALAWVGREQDNLRVALRWWIDRGAAREALEMAGTLYFHWLFAGLISEGVELLDAVLALPVAADEPPALRARALAGRAGLEIRVGRPGETVRLARAALAAAQACGDPRALGHAHFVLAMAAFEQGEDEAARSALASMSEETRATGDRYWEAIALPLGALLDERRGRIDAAREALARSVALFRRLGQLWGLSRSLSYAAAFELRQGEPAQALERAREALVAHRELGSVWVEAESFATLSAVIAMQGNESGAALLAGIAAGLADRHAARPVSDVTACGDDASGPLARPQRPALATQWSRGYQLSLDEAIRSALALTLPSATR